MPFVFIFHEGEENIQYLKYSTFSEVRRGFLNALPVSYDEGGGTLLAINATCWLTVAAVLLPKDNS